MTALDIRGLTKTYGDTRAVDEVSFTVRSGTITGFLGPNGAGKTTTLRCLLGLARPDSGEGLINGQRYAALKNPITHVGAALEGTSFHPGRSARNHLRTVCEAAGIPLTRADEVLSEVELSQAARKRVGRFSMGMRQRLTLANALLGRPKVLILDEPANGLDPAGIDWLRGFLRKQVDEHGATVLVSSHVLTEVAQTVDEVVIVSRGRLVKQGSLASVTQGGANLHDVFLELTGETPGGGST